MISIDVIVFSHQVLFRKLDGPPKSSVELPSGLLPLNVYSVKIAAPPQKENQCNILILGCEICSFDGSNP